MTGINLFAAQENVLDYARAEIPWSVDSGAVPDAESLQLEDGVLVPYVVARFSDMMPSSGGNSFGGAKWDEYYTYVDFLCVAATDREARELASLVNAKMVGKAFPNTSELRPNFGGGVFAVMSGERTPAAFVAVVSLRYYINIQDVGSDYLS